MAVLPALAAVLGDIQPLLQDRKGTGAKAIDNRLRFL